jgi:hypothetical protein
LKDILKTQRFDMPPNIENTRADWQKVTSAVDYELVQARAKFKKEVSHISPVFCYYLASVIDTSQIARSTASAKNNEPAILDSDRTNIFDLTQKMISGTRCVINAGLCARVAMMVSFPIVFLRRACLSADKVLVVAKSILEAPRGKILG